jgi:hypothetical protein
MKVLKSSVEINSNIEAYNANLVILKKFIERNTSFHFETFPTFCEIAS